MAIGTLDVVGLGLLFVGTCVAIWWFVIAWRYKSFLGTSSFARGANVAGRNKKAQLSCDAGHEICVYRATMICSNPQANNYENPSTDPISNGKNGVNRYGEYDAKTTTSLTAKMGSKCNGNASCEYDFSGESFPGGITCSAENVQLISSYTCIPQGTACVASS